MKRRLDKLKHNNSYVKEYFEEFCSMAMRVGFV